MTKIIANDSFNHLKQVAIWVFSTIDKNYEQKHEMCKTNMKMDIYYTNKCSHEHEKNMTRLWCKIVLKSVVKHIEGNEKPYSYLYPFGDLTQGSF